MTESLNDFKIQRHEAAHRQIARNLRERILRGKIRPGARLPSTEELAETWGASYFTVHMALKALVKEGLLERLHGSGTYVRERKASLSIVGVYLGSNVMTTANAEFPRYVYAKIEERLRQRGVSVVVFVESRPQSELDTVLPALKEAVDLREIQALAVVQAAPREIAAFGKLPIPTAVVSGMRLPFRASFDTSQFIRESVAKLKAQGCRSVGFVTHMIRLEEGEAERLYGPNGADEFWAEVRRELAANGMESRDEWLLGPAEPPIDLPKVGYTEFKGLWRLPQRPEGLVVWPDSVAKGAVLAILQSGVQVPKELKCVFHRNSHQSFLCPFPVTWGITDEEELADALIDLIDRQFAGEPISEVTLDYTFEEGRGIED